MKIIASDYDGTLRRHHGIDQKDRDAVKKWRENGNLFGIVTGRDQPWINNFINEDKLEVDFLIIYNGTDIYEFDGGQAALFKRFLGKSDRLYDMLPLILRKDGDYANFITPEREYYVTYNDSLVDLDKHWGYVKNTWVKNEALKNVREFIQIYTLYKTDTEALEVARNLNDGFSGDVSALVNGSWLNAAPSGVTKASGVREYAKLKSVCKENIFTIGDSYNDLDMIKEFNGFTLDNGADALKKTARAIYKGVWELIDNFN